MLNNEDFPAPDYPTTPIFSFLLILNDTFVRTGYNSVLYFTSTSSNYIASSLFSLFSFSSFSSLSYLSSFGFYIYDSSEGILVYYVNLS